MEPQCQFYVLRKKRLCRMSVRPGRRYCGEHEPRPLTDGEQGDTRIPCPNDPKHTCYASKLQKHLSICNARRRDEPDYIERDVNAPPERAPRPRRPLALCAARQLRNVVNKINQLYDEHVEGNIDTVPELPIHAAVREEFDVEGRTESSLRHLRQASSIMHLVEAEGLVRDNTCYVELGAGKGHLSVFAARAWCGAGSASRVLLVERAALRHKRDNVLRQRGEGAGDASGRPALRLRADLAHLRLQHAPGVSSAAAVVGLAKHLCGVATDYALRCMTSEPAGKTAGMVIATCCHHRCQPAAYVGELQELGISSEEFDIMLGVVSWATCGDGRARDRRIAPPSAPPTHSRTNDVSKDSDKNNVEYRAIPDGDDEHDEDEAGEANGGRLELGTKGREEVGRRAKALLDWGRVAYLRRRGFRARLCRFVARAVSPEDVCIVAGRGECGAQ